VYRTFRRFLFQFYPETSHAFTLYALRSAGAFPPVLRMLELMYAAPVKPVQAFGLTFKNPVGLAAGYDKNGVAIRGLAALGFGHIEIGTVTPRPQPGNPKPRSFRLVEDQAVINRLGFPSRGAEFVGKRLAVTRRKAMIDQSSVVIGLNLGKNKDTPIEEAAKDYTQLMRRFMSPADYLTINISSPNTVGLRRLQGRELLEGLLSEIKKERESISTGRGGHAPILVKISPDMDHDELEDAVGAILNAGMDGIIATNTTLAREGLRSRYQGEAGGLSGSPLTVKSEAVLSQVVNLVNGKIPIVSVGGIMNPDDAKKRLALGASLVQVYTGMIYRGPKLVQEITAGL